MYTEEQAEYHTKYFIRSCYAYGFINICMFMFNSFVWYFTEYLQNLYYMGIINEFYINMLTGMLPVHLIIMLIIGSAIYGFPALLCFNATLFYEINCDYFSFGGKHFFRAMLVLFSCIPNTLLMSIELIATAVTYYEHAFMIAAISRLFGVFILMFYMNRILQGCKSIYNMEKANENKKIK
jgi:hypothetical protein